MNEMSNRLARLVGNRLSLIGCDAVINGEKCYITYVSGTEEHVIEVIATSISSNRVVARIKVCIHPDDL